MLKLSPSESNVSYIAAFEAIRGGCFAASTVLGGALGDHLSAQTISVARWPPSFLTYVFVLGWAGRSGLRPFEGHLTRADLASADEAFLCSSVAGVLPNRTCTPPKELGMDLPSELS